MFATLVIAYYEHVRKTGQSFSEVGAIVNIRNRVYLIINRLHVSFFTQNYENFNKLCGTG